MSFFTNTQKSIQDMVDSSQGVLRNVLNVFGDMEEEYEPKDKGVSLHDATNNPYSDGGSGGAQSYGNIRRYVSHEEMSKEQKLSVYRQMSEYPEINLALNTVTDEIITPDSSGTVAKLSIVNQRLLNNINIKDNIQKEWDYVYYDLYDFDRTSWEMSYNFLITGEIFIEKVSNPDAPHKGLRKIRRLQPDNIFVNWDYDDNPIHFKVKLENSTEPLIIGKHQMTYVNYGQFALNSSTGERICLSYLEKIKKIWRQLQLLEEAVVIYRVVRAPEKRLFRIATGNMPKHKQDEYMKKVMMQYRQKKVYNTNTGEIDGQANIQNMLEDYFFSQPETGQGSSVDTLGGGDNLGEITDLDYFLKKLYRALQIPESRRLDNQVTYNAGQLNDVTHQELKFAKLINRISRSISDVLLDGFITHLKLKGLWKQYGLTERDFRIEFSKDSYYEEFKEAHIMEMRMNNWSNGATYIGQVFSKEYACKKFLNMSAEDIQENKDMIKKEKEEGELDDFQGGF
jgi:hypothetical protein